STRRSDVLRRHRPRHRQGDLLSLLFSLLLLCRHPRATLFPYTTLFRSARPGSCPGRLGGIRGAYRPARARRHAGPAAANATKATDRKSTRLNSSHVKISYAVFCLKKKNRSGWSNYGVRVVTVPTDSRSC